jgi:hypothetical protein
MVMNKPQKIAKLANRLIAVVVDSELNNADDLDNVFAAFAMAIGHVLVCSTKGDRDMTGFMGSMRDVIEMQIAKSERDTQPTRSTLKS